MQIPGTALLVQWLRIHLLTGEEFGGEWIRVYVWLSPFTVHLNLLRYCLLIGSISIQNRKLKKQKGFVFQSRDAGSLLGRGNKIPHAEGQLCPCATTKTQHSQKIST